MPSGSGAPKQTKQWEYFESLQFLDDVLEPCQEVISIPIESPAEDGKDKESDVVSISILDEASKTFLPPIETSRLMIFCNQNDLDPGVHLYLTVCTVSLRCLCRHSQTLSPKRKKWKHRRRRMNFSKD